MPASKQITFEPAFTLMLTQHFHNTAIGCNIFVDLNDFSCRATICYPEHISPSVRSSFVRTEDTEVGGVKFYNVADKLTLNARGFFFYSARVSYLYSVIMEIRHF